MKKLLTSNTGFTLIELLIVITIIVIVIGVGAVSYTTVAKNARDSQRKSDLAKIAEALEQSYSDFHVYPAVNDNNSNKQNTLLMCFNAGHDSTNGNLGQYHFIQIAKATINSQTSRQFACQDFYTGNINTYMQEVPFDPLNTNNIPGNNSPIDASYYYTYFSYNKDGVMCNEFGTPAPFLRCPLQETTSDYKPIAYKYKLVAIVENKNNATNAPGDQISPLCRKANYCYVVSSPNF